MPPKKYALNQRGLQKVLHKLAPAKRKPKRRAPRALITNTLRAPIPRFAYLTFQQKYKFVINSASATTGQYYVKANSIWKPCNGLATTGLTAAAGYSGGADTYAFVGQYIGDNSLYNDARIYRAKLTVSTPGVLGSGTDLINIAIGRLDGTTTYSGYRALSEGLGTVESKDFIGIYRPRHISNTLDVAKVYGVTRSQLMADSAFVGNTTADPSLQAQFVIGWQNVTGVNTTANIPVEVTLQCWMRAEKANMDNV